LDGLLEFMVVEQPNANEYACSFDFFAKFAPLFGVWRSWLAYLHGVQGVGSSSLLTPTKKNSEIARWRNGVTFRHFYFKPRGFFMILPAGLILPSAHNF
jgi:hypothetical protein